jgi:ABC-type Fe3+ transport system permease subunit
MAPCAQACLVTAAIYLGWIIAIVLIAVGLYAWMAPHSLARRYGVSVEGERETAYVRATGIRDVAIGVVLAATAYLHVLPLLIVVAAVGVLVSVADLWVVARHGGHHRPHVAHAVYASGIVAFILVIAMALFAIGR